MNELKVERIESNTGFIIIQEKRITIPVMIFTVLYLYCKHKKLQVKVINWIQENPNLNEGRVTLSIPRNYDNKNKL